MNGSAVPITRSAGNLAVVAGLEALPEGCERLFLSPTRCLFGSLPWYRTVLDHAMPAGATPAFACYSESGTPRAAFPLLRLADGGLTNLTTPYTCVHRPPLATDAGAPVLAAAAEALGRFCRAWPTVRLDALEAEWPGLEALIAGLRRAGLVVQRFDHFGNWHEPIAGSAWAPYLAARPGSLRETIRRKLARAEREAEFAILRGPVGLEAGIDAFEDVYRRSWKDAEPFPRFNAALIRVTAALGLLRLGILRVGGTAVAVQFWVVTSGTATVLKLAHDEAFRPLSPGTVLTALMIRALLAEGGITALDFGRGDDPYKSLWTTQRRQRVGLILVNPRRPAGLAMLGRHWLGRARRAFRAG